MSVVTLAEMRRALANTLGKQGMSPDEIASLAEQIMNYFGFDDFVVDNRLTSSERDMFYMLEEAGFLSTLQEEVSVAKGKVWRIHYWILRFDNIKKFSEATDKAAKEEVFEVYKSLGDDAWRHQE